MKKILAVVYIFIFCFTSGCFEDNFTNLKISNYMEDENRKNYKIDTHVAQNQNTAGIVYIGKDLINYQNQKNIKPTKKFSDISQNLFIQGKRMVESAESNPEFCDMTMISNELFAPYEIKNIIKKNDLLLYFNGLISYPEFLTRLQQISIPSTFVRSDLIMVTLIQIIKMKNTELLQLLLHKKGETKSNQIAPLFTLYLIESLIKENFDIEILDLKKASLPNNDTIIYLKIKDSYTLSEENKNKTLIFPSGTVLNLCFVLLNKQASDKLAIQKIMTILFSLDQIKNLDFGIILAFAYKISQISIKEIHMLDGDLNTPLKYKDIGTIGAWDTLPAHNIVKVDFIKFLESIIENKFKYNLKTAVYGEPNDIPFIEKFTPNKEKKFLLFFIPNAWEIQKIQKNIISAIRGTYRFIDSDLLTKTPFYIAQKIYGFVFNLKQIYILNNEQYLYKYHFLNLFYKEFNKPITHLQKNLNSFANFIKEFVENVEKKTKTDVLDLLFDIKATIINKQVNFFTNKKTILDDNAIYIYRWLKEHGSKLSAKTFENIILKSVKEVSTMYDYEIIDILIYDLYNTNTTALKNT